MKHIYTILALIFLLSGCGVGSYTISSGLSDEGAVVFTAAREYPIEVSVDGNLYSVNTVKSKAYKNDRRIRQTSENMVKVATGQHRIEVRHSGEVLYSRIVFISAGESKVIGL